MYQTGKQYNLKIDSYIDERSDPLKSSAAAAKYMSNMYSIFGDWELVLASYNPVQVMFLKQSDVLGENKIIGT
jgi:membrane-bound lytic murein transglycosylase D